MKFGSHPKTDEYLESIVSHGFLPVITNYMRLTPSSTTLIDKIYTYNISTPTDAGVIVTDAADHVGMLYAQKCKLTCTQKSNQRQIRSCS